MAIKGKKKSQQRGSQARRRPAPAPRPVPVSRRNLPWYRTQQGRLTAALLGALAIGLIVWAVVNARSNAEDLERRQDVLVGYTSEVRAVLQVVRPAATEMTAVPGTPEAASKDLAKSSVQWLATITSAQQQMGSATPSASVSSLNPIYVQAINTYASAARLYELVPQADGDVARQLLQRAAEQRDQAGSLWQSATAVLDDLRGEADLPASDLQPPSAPATGVPALPGSEGAGTGGGGNGGNGDGGG